MGIFKKNSKEVSPLGRFRKVISGEYEMNKQLEGVLLSDAQKLFGAYFDIVPESVKFSTSLGEDGKIIIKLECVAERIKNIKVI